MPAGIEIYNYVTNQKGSPAIWSDTLGARPPAGFTGRIFISIDTLEVYRDNGFNWDLIGSGGGGVNIYNSNGSLTGTRFVNMAASQLWFQQSFGSDLEINFDNPNASNAKTLFFNRSTTRRIGVSVKDNEIGNNTGSNFYIDAYGDNGLFLLTPFAIERGTGQKNLLANKNITNGTQVLTGQYNITTSNYTNNIFLTGGNPHGANHNNFTLKTNGNLDIDNAIFLGAQSNVLRVQGPSGQVTNLPALGLRASCANLNQIQFNLSAGVNLIYTQLAVNQSLGIYRLTANGTLQINNAYSLLLNSLNEYNYTNINFTGGRWGIFQAGLLDINYFNGPTLIGTQINAGYKFDVSGTIRSQDAISINLNTIPAAGTNLTRLYCNDIAPNHSALHIRNENGTILKMYQETTAVTAATVVHNPGGTAIKTQDTFDGYTLEQVVKALRNQGLLN